MSGGERYEMSKYSTAVRRAVPPVRIIPLYSSRRMSTSHLLMVSNTMPAHTRH